MPETDPTAVTPATAAPGAEPSPFVQRKAAELHIKLDSLDRELDDWTARSAAGKPLEKHHTQIRRLATVLRELSTLAKGELHQAVKDGRVLDVARELERTILEAHRSWDFFRSKLVLRDVALFRPALRAADALAWACYRPAREAAGKAAPREPPLVFLNGGTSPFVLPRGERFFAESTLLGEDIATPEVDDLLRALPVPVVGIPWFHVDHAPDMLVLGHEIGHAAEGDFGLTAEVAALLDGAGIPDERRAAWASWLGEVLADVYGALALGPAFMRCLADFLAGAPADVMSEQRAEPFWGTYPTSALRILLVTEVLAKPFPADATAAWTAWKKLYPTHAMSAFEPDARAVAAALCDGALPALGGKSLRAIVAFTPEHQADAAMTARLLLHRRRPTATDVRALFAGARIAFETSPEKYAEQRVTQVLFERVAEVEESGVRAGGPAAAAITNDDAALGKQLFEALRAARKRGPTT